MNLCIVLSVCSVCCMITTMDTTLSRNWSCFSSHTCVSFVINAGICHSNLSTMDMWTAAERLWSPPACGKPLQCHTCLLTPSFSFSFHSSLFSLIHGSRLREGEPGGGEVVEVCVGLNFSVWSGLFLSDAMVIGCVCVCVCWLWSDTHCSCQTD